MPAHRISSTFWRVVTPSVWPEAPRWMSFSTLLELEACPRRWALKAAQYPEVWEHTGYPSVPQSAALEGVVVHSAIERIASALAERGCASLRDESAIETLMELGGYTGIVGECIGRALRQYQGNPRAESVLETVRRGLATHLPELRSRVQRQVSRIRPAVRVSRPISTTIQPERQTRSQIHDGYHVEVEVRVPELAWHGFVDLLALSKDFCEIRDFKTGAMKDAHEFQLRIYAFLWARDHELNPSGRRADKLVLSYNDRDVEVSAQSTEALHSVGEEIRTRTGKALAAIQLHAPEARPNSENCSYCSVRHLCDEYWKWPGRHGEDQGLPTVRFADVEIALTGRHGPSSWDGVLEASPGSDSTQPALLRTANLQFDLQPGQKIRVLNVHIKSPNEDEGLPVVATMGANSEMFLLPP